MKNPELNFNKPESLNPQKESMGLINRIHKIKDRLSELPPDIANSLKIIIPALVFMALPSKGMSQTTPDTNTQKEQSVIYPGFESTNPNQMTEEEKEDAKEKADDVIRVVLDNTKYEDMYNVAKDVVKIFKKDDE